MKSVRISDTDLAKIYGDIPAWVLGDHTLEALTLGNFVVRRFLGNEWARTHIEPTGNKGYLTIDESTPKRREETLFRVIDLAELLINLQNVPGFDGCIGKLLKGDLESTCAELDLGRLLYVYKIDFRYVQQIGVRGADYDIEFKFPNGVAACTEAKCKVDSTAFGAHKVCASLEKCVDQLPPDRPCVAFVKVPQHWINHPHYEQLMGQVAHDFLAQHPKFVSVKYYVFQLSFERFPDSEYGTMDQLHTLREISNPANCFDRSHDWRLHPQIPWNPNASPPHWRHILHYPDGIERKPLGAPRLALAPA
jgi:hypothetical protein